MEFDITPISNVKKDGSIRDPVDDDVVKSLRGNMEWHHDSTYMPIQAKGSVFTAHTVPGNWLHERQKNVVNINICSGPLSEHIMSSSS